MDPDPDPELSALLRARRPEPTTAFVAATERQLFRPRRRRRWAPAQLRLGTAFAAGLAALALILSLAGVGPLAGSDRAVQADDGCHTARIIRTERVPSVVTGTDGEPRIVYTEREVPHLEKVCR